ncbi:MAG: hypothetical protein E3J81_06260, partial [Dehalococcoidia bacterium]
MADYAYVMVTGKLRKFMNRIPEVGVPRKVTTEYLASLGFKSSNERAIIPLLKFIGFLDDSGAPTNDYKIYRDTMKGPSVLGRAIKQSYSELFDIHPDAQSKDTEALRNFFSIQT